jgi:hypothetical protein
LRECCTHTIIGILQILDDLLSGVMLPTQIQSARDAHKPLIQERSNKCCVTFSTQLGLTLGSKKTQYFTSSSSKRVSIRFIKGDDELLKKIVQHGACCVMSGSPAGLGNSTQEPDGTTIVDVNVAQVSRLQSAFNTQSSTICLTK